MDGSIYPLTHDRPYTFGELRAAEKMLLAERQADQTLSSRLRLQDRKQIDWAKTRNEEWSPLKLLADGLGLVDEDTFRWTPAGAADFVIASRARTLKVQCTMAYDERSEGHYRGGHLHRKEQEFGATTDSISEAAGFLNLLPGTLRKILSHGEPALCRRSNPK